MKDNAEPKTLEDYRDMLKVLKLKVIKQAKIIQQQQEKIKNYESQHQKTATSLHPRGQPSAIETTTTPFTPSELQKDFEYNNIKNKSIVMYLFQKGAQKLGLSLEGIFRYADVEYKNAVDSDYFRVVLSKLQLGLTLKQISCIVFICDEGCTGTITREDYYHSLEAYQVLIQDTPKTFANDSLLKFSEIMRNKNMDPEAFYDEMSQNGRQQVDANLFETTLKKKFGNQLQQRQIVGAFNQIDFESQGFFEKSNFIYSIRAYTSKLRNGGDSKNINASANPNIKGGTGTSHTKVPSLGAGSLKNTESIGGKGTTTPVKPPQKALDNPGGSTNKKEESTAEPPKQPAKPTRPELTLFDVIRELERNEADLPTIYPHILHLNFTKPITLWSFSKVIKGIAPEVALGSIGHLFRCIDKAQKGTVTLKDLTEFFLENAQDLDITFRLIVKYFEVHEMDSTKFFYVNAVKQNETVSRKDFMKIFSPALGIKQDLLSPVWNYFDKHNSGQASVDLMIKQFKQYQP